MRSRTKVVNTVNSFLGLKESDGSYKKIIDIYNDFKGKLPRGTKMQYDWAWCGCTYSAVAILLGYTDIMPIEISCNELIKKAKEMGCWTENDGYVPLPGDGIIYDWQDNGVGDNTGWPDHVGIITSVNKDAGYFVVTEGNYNDEVKKRTISINGRYIRGFITPKFDTNTVSSKPKTPATSAGKDITTIAREVIAGEWGNMPNRQKLLEKAGYNYEEVRKKVNVILNDTSKTTSPALKGKEVTSTCAARHSDSKLSGKYVTIANVYCRNDAGGNKKALCLIPEGTEVMNYGYYNTYENVKWLYIQFTLNGIKYSGFSTSKYLKKK